VVEDRCAGCGFCEHYCPVQHRAAIVVSPMGALRTNQGAYREAGKQQGLDLRLKAGGPVPPPAAEGDGGRIDLAPGFDPE
jgi:ferredoxin